MMKDTHLDITLFTSTIRGCLSTQSIRNLTERSCHKHPESVEANTEILRKLYNCGGIHGNNRGNKQQAAEERMERIYEGLY